MNRQVCAVLLLLSLVGCGGKGVFGPTAEKADAGASTNVGPIADFFLRFQSPVSTRMLDCSVAGVTSIRFQFFEPTETGLLLTEVIRPCVQGQTQRVSIEAGQYQVKIQGLNAQLTVCYEKSVPVLVEARKSERQDIVLPEHPDGARNGCLYP